jgi:hypothetical protein
MTTKKAVDLIYDIDKKLDSLILKIEVIEASINGINNKIYAANEKIFAIEESILNIKSSQSAVVSLPPAQPVISGSASGASLAPEKSKKLMLGNVKMFGYVYNVNRSPIKGVEIRVFDSNNAIVKDLTTDSEGLWEARVRAGSYSVEYRHSMFKPVVKNINIAPGIKEFEVK